MKGLKKIGILLTPFLAIVLLFIIPYYSMSFSKNLVIRRTLILNGHPFVAFTTNIQNTPDSKDKIYGMCYVIHNHKVNNGTESSIPGVCLKKNKYGLYYVSSIGVW